MKTLLISLAAVALVLAFGTVYAAEKEMGWDLSNGVTVFESHPAPSTVGEGSALALENGITIFDTGIGIAKAEEYGTSGSAAGGMASEEPYNGVTVFELK